MDSAALMAAFNFDEIDLAQNRAGCLTEQQSADIQQRSKRVFLYILIPAIALAAWIGVGAGREEGTQFGVIIGLVLFAGFSGPFLLIWWLRFPRITRRGTVERIEGPAEAFKVKQADAIGVGKGIKGRHFLMTSKHTRLFDGHGNYAFYFTRSMGGNRLHSVEYMGYSAIAEGR